MSWVILIHLQPLNLYHHLTISTPHQTKPASPLQPPTPKSSSHPGHPSFASLLPSPVSYTPKSLPFLVDAQHCLDTFRTNTIGLHFLMKYFSLFLPKKKPPLSRHRLFLDNSLGGMVFLPRQQSRRK